MSGIFDIMNHPGAGGGGGGTPTMAPSFVDGILLMRIAGIRTNQQLITLVESWIGRTLTSEEMQDFSDIVAYIEAGTGESGKVARLHRFTAVAGIWETGQGAITEAEARTMTGVTFT